MDLNIRKITNDPPSPVISKYVEINKHVHTNSRTKNK